MSSLGLGLGIHKTYGTAGLAPAPGLPIVISSPGGTYPGNTLYAVGGRETIFDEGNVPPEYEGLEDAAVVYHLYRNGVDTGVVFFGDDPVTGGSTILPFDFAPGDIIMVVDDYGTASNGLTIGDFDVDAADYISRVKATGAVFGTTPSQERRTEWAVNEFVKMSKEAIGPLGISNWLAYQTAVLPAGPTTLEGAIVTIRGDMPAITNFNFVQGDLNRGGLKGDAATKYLLTNWLNSSVPQNDRSILVHCTEGETVNSTRPIGHTGSDGASHTTLEIGDYGLRVSLCGSARRTISGSAIGEAGFFGGSRSSASELVLQRNADQSVVADVASEGFIDGTMRFFGGGTGSGPYRPSDARIAFAACGRAVDLAASRLAISTYMAAIS